jgi:hypothetical protein
LRDARHIVASDQRHAWFVTHDPAPHGSVGEDARMDGPTRGPGAQEEREMAEKRIEPKAPTANEPAAGARKATRETAKAHKTLAKQHKTLAKQHKTLARKGKTTLKVTPTL